MKVYRNKKNQESKHTLNVSKFIDLLIGTTFLTMSMFLIINIRPFTFWTVSMIVLYLLVGILFIAKRKLNSRI